MFVVVVVSSTTDNDDFVFSSSCSSCSSSSSCSSCSCSFAICALKGAILDKSPIKISVLIFLSWASSNKMIEYFVNKKSC
jgi:hypothetical protein